MKSSRAYSTPKCTIRKTAIKLNPNSRIETGQLAKDFARLIAASSQKAQATPAIKPYVWLNASMRSLVPHQGPENLE
jgi:hypothetical protein